MAVAGQMPLRKMTEHFLRHLSYTGSGYRDSAWGGTACAMLGLIAWHD